jgi:glycosidase
VRSDFPGGWAGDTINAYTGQGLTAQQLEAQAYIKKLLHWRQSATAIHNGQLKHFLPENGVYVYFRYNDDQTIMIVINKGETQKLILSRFEEIIENFNMAKNIMTGKKVELAKSLELADRSVNVYELIN